MNEWKKEGKKEGMNEWMNEWINERMSHYETKIQSFSTFSGVIKPVYYYYY